MFRKIAAIAGVLAGLSCSLPQVFAQNPEAMFRTLKQSLSEVVRSASQSEARPSQALIDRETARSMSYDNQIKHTKTFFDKRKLNRDYRAAEASPRHTKADFARYNENRKPDRLNANQFNTINGRINWPVLLKTAHYDSQRRAIENLFRDHSAAGGGINTYEYAKIKNAVRALEADFNANASGTEAEQRLYTRKFIESLAYEARQPVGA